MTRSSTPSCSRRPCRSTPSTRCGCWRRASTALWRSRSPSPSPTRSARWTRRRRAGRVLMVGHLLEYHPGVQKLKELADGGELGQIYYIYGNRLNLGKLRADENALWSLGAHDVSVLLHLAGEEPTEAIARGESYLRPGVEDVVFCFLRFPSGLSAHLHLSWLDPHKERRFTVVGARRMATFDDMALEGKVTSTTRDSTRTLTATVNTSPAVARSSRRGSPTRSRCESSASTSSTASSRAAARALTERAGCGS